jgi:hypothetical protein
LGLGIRAGLRLRMLGRKREKKRGGKSINRRFFFFIFLVAPLRLPPASYCNCCFGSFSP